MKNFHFCLWLSIFSITTVFSQDVSRNDSIPQNAVNPEIGYIDLYAGGAFGYVDGFAGGVNISFLYSNVLFTLGFVSNNEQGGLEYVDNTDILPLNYYKHGTYPFNGIVMLFLYICFQS
jgi:hypothetical protein